MDELVKTARAFAEPARVRILAALRGGESCVCELADGLAMTQSTLSTHLQIIREAGLVQTRREGKWVYYALRPEARRLVETVFGFFPGALADDATLARDGRRLAARLKERENGACCVGFVRPARRAPTRHRVLS